MDRSIGVSGSGFRSISGALARLRVAALHSCRWSLASTSTAQQQELRRSPAVPDSCSLVVAASTGEPGGLLVAGSPHPPPPRIIRSQPCMGAWTLRRCRRARPLALQAQWHEGAAAAAAGVLEGDGAGPTRRIALGG
jgi:hypothetical protein